MVLLNENNRIQFMVEIFGSAQGTGGTTARDVAACLVIYGLGVLFETFFANWLNARFFFRSPQKDEVDFILYDRKNVLPVEVKIRERLSKKDLRPMKKFMTRFKCQQALMIAKNDDRIEREKRTVKF